MKKNIVKLIEEWIEELEKKINDHWEKLDKYGYVDYPKSDDSDAFGIWFKGNYFDEYHEGNSASGALWVLKMLLKEVIKWDG